MAFTNVHRSAQISPTKVRPIVDLIRGKRIDVAISLMQMCKNRGAVFVEQAINAARANADQAEADIRRLYVVDARVDSGRTLKRFQPKDRGRAHPIKKRTSHITVALDER